MSRRLPDAGDAGAPGDATTPERDPGLLTAYVDGVAELSPDERRRVETLLARDPQARADQAAVGKLLDQLRQLHDLPAAGEPDWTALERSIRQAVGPDVPRPWWRRWRWLAPATMLATAAAVLLAMWTRSAEVSPPTFARAAHVPRPAEEIVPLWLDGSEVDVDVSASDMLADPELGTSSDDDPAPLGADSDEVALLPSTDLAWIDKLDDDAIDRAERWLARKKG
jgi:anti-sigma factor RsiW